MNATSRLGFCLVAIAAMLAGFSCMADPLQKLRNPEKTQGEVRVLLLRVNQTVSTNGEPTFVVTYAIEIPTKGAFSDLHISSANEITLFARGKAIDLHGSTSGSMAFKDLPRQDELSKPVTPDGRVLLATEVVFTNLKIDTKELNIRIQFSWRGKEFKFEFEKVPVR